MKILLSCINANGFGGSEMYHYELAREFDLIGHDVTLFTLRHIDWMDQTRLKLQHVKQLDTTNLDISEKYDIIVASQPQVNLFMLEHFKETPIISIIHSEIRSEDPVLDPRISHYIAIRQSIADMLINEYKIPAAKVSLIYNPIDRSRFNSAEVGKLERHSGIFVGEVLDPIRFNAVRHLVTQCIENDWDLYLMSDSRYDFKHPNIKYVDKRWDTENLVQMMHFTAGILLGRTTLEGWCCDVPGYMYLIDIDGNILSIETIAPYNIVELCKSTYVANQHIQLYTDVINKVV
jgi:glycosyltransferase involved in cell wall biosynthesis